MNMPGKSFDNRAHGQFAVYHCIQIFQGLQILSEACSYQYLCSRRKLESRIRLVNPLLVQQIKRLNGPPH